MVFFGRHGGVSAGVYESLNCGPGSDDAPDAVAENRKRCLNALGANDLATVYQVHSAKAVYLESPQTPPPEADAIVTGCPGLAIGILTADCMPVLLHDPAAQIIGAAHAGWKGALAGVLENCVSLMTRHGAQPDRIRAAIGPCLQQPNFEVGFDLIDAFSSKYKDMDRFLSPASDPEKRLFDLTGFGCWRLEEAGLKHDHIDVLPQCTLGAPADFFSYRHSRKAGLADYGRNLSAILLTAG